MKTSNNGIENNTEHADNEIASHCGEIFPEPVGCVCKPGFVKKNPKNNRAYVAMCVEDFPPAWADAIVEADEKLEALMPGYNISQIKEKFWSLVFYFDAPVGTDPNILTQAYDITHQAAYKAGIFQSGAMTPPENFPHPFWTT